MTLTTLVTVNAILGTVLVHGLLYLLGLGIHREHRARFEPARGEASPPAREHDRLAA